MKIVIKNCTLISMSEKQDKIQYDMDVLINDNIIEKIGKNIDCKNIEKVIDASGKVVMPGLINTHSHVPMSIFRETLDGYDLQDWLTKKIWPMEDKLNKNDIYYASFLSFIEMIRTGTTTINDMYFISDEIIRAMDESGVRLQIGRSLMDVDGADSGKERFDESLSLISKYNNYNSRLTMNVAIHGLYTSSSEYVQKCIDLAHEVKLPMHMHFCENSNEIHDIINLHNMSPIDILIEKFNNNRILLAHCVKMTSLDIDKVKDMNISISHCPVSNLKLGCGIARISDFVEKGINVSLGTDGQGSGSNLDLFEVMKYTALLQKGINEDPKKLPAYEVLKMATINGAKALGLEDDIGSIEEGKKADIIVIDMDTILCKPNNDIISNLVYNIKGTDVDTTIIDGNILMENKKLCKVDAQEIFKECEKTIERIRL